MVCRPYPRRLESLTVCSCHYVNNITCPIFFCSIHLRYNRFTVGLLQGDLINVSNICTGKPTVSLCKRSLVFDHGPVAREPVNANLELKSIKAFISLVEKRF